MKVYLIQRNDGYYLMRPVRRGRWNPDMNRAAYYTNIGPAKAAVTTYFISHSTEPCPIILEFDLSTMSPVQIIHEQKAVECVDKKINKLKSYKTPAVPVRVVHDSDSWLNRQINYYEDAKSKLKKTLDKP